MAGPTSVEEYLAALPEESRAALLKLRKLIKDAAPEATETISYHMPAFKDNDRLLVSYAAFKDHYSLFPMSLAVIDANLEELRPHLSGRATLRFDREKPPSAALVKRIVKARLEENAARRRPRG
jgi:uncharacterized protein YdhG (YjbR/CyaY superfamily)